jgi:ATP-dependent Lon protease
VPSAVDPEKFKCYSDLAKAGVITGYIFSCLSSLFSLYKLRVLVRERTQKLKDAGIEPSLRRIVFLERTLANHCKLMLVPVTDDAEQRSAGDEGRPGVDDAVAQMMRDVQRQLQEQLKQQLQEQLKQQQQHHEQQQQLLQEQLKQLQEQLKQQQHHDQQQQQLQEQLKQQQQHHHKQQQQLQQQMVHLQQQIQELTQQK